MPTLPSTDPSNSQLPTTVTINGVTAAVSAIPEDHEKGIEIGEGPFRRLVYTIPDGTTFTNNGITFSSAVDTFMDGLMGIGQSVTITFQGPVQFPTPHRYPGNLNLMCIGVVARGTGPISPGPTLAYYGVARVTATYGVPKWDAYGQDNNNAFGGVSSPWIRDNVRTQVEEITYTPKGKTAHDLITGATLSTPVTQTMTKRVPLLEYTRRVFKIPWLDIEYLWPLAGSVNNGTFWYCSKGTLLFDGIETEASIESDGSYTQEYVMTFRRRPVDWNAELQDNVFAFALIKDLDGNTNYQYMDFTPILNFGIS